MKEITGEWLIKVETEIYLPVDWKDYGRKKLCLQRKNSFSDAYDTGRHEISYKKGDEPTRKSFSEEV